MTRHRHPRSPALLVFGLWLATAPGMAWGQAYLKTEFPIGMTSILGDPSTAVLLDGSFGEFDNTTSSQTLPFTLQFFGLPYDGITISSDGHVNFEAFLDPANINEPLPSPAGPNGVIALFWDDLIIRSGAASTIAVLTEGLAPDRVFVVEWSGLGRVGEDAAGEMLTGQLRIYEGSHVIELHYAAGQTWTGVSATIGLEDETGSTGLGGPGTGADIAAPPGVNYRFSPPIWGDGVVSPSEVCDDGNLRSGDGCSSDCLSDESCGNGIVDTAAGEACDDGNTDNFDGCSALCTLESCGDGVLDAAEICDDGNNDDGDGCSANCQSDETCGNGHLDSVPGETCDDGNRDNGDGCSAGCLLETCGDGVVDPLESCDDGNNEDGDGCSATCLSDETCGNNVVDLDEGCDDGNNTDGDGCSAVCVLESGGAKKGGCNCAVGGAESGSGLPIGLAFVLVLLMLGRGRRR